MLFWPLLDLHKYRINIGPGEGLMPEFQKYVAVVLPTQLRWVFRLTLKKLRVYELRRIVKNAFRMYDLCVGVKTSFLED
jgi:hypothetical protein